MARFATPRAVDGLIALLIIWLSAAAGGSLRAQPPGESAGATAEQITAWIEQLDADQFLVRETAMQELIAAGPAVIEPLVKAIRNQRWELNVRCVHVLQQIALNGDSEAEELARAALENVARSTVRSAAQKAHETLAGIGAIRQMRALHELVRLGAKTLPDRPQVVPYIYGIEIGEDWVGTEKDLNQLRWLQDIQQVTFTGEKVNNQWLGAIVDLPNLTWVVVKRASITDEGIEQLHRIRQLRILELKYVAVTDASVPHLARLNTASDIRLFGTAITAEGAGQLRTQLQGTKVDHRAGAFLGIGGDFHPLGCVVLEVRANTAASSAGLMPGDVIVSYDGQRVADFDALTGLISHNRPADRVAIEFVRHAENRTAGRTLKAGDELGITGKDHIMGSEVVEIEPKSLAEQLGMRPGDVVYRYNGQLIDSHATLSALLQATKPGENATLEFVRRLDLKRAEVTLGEWD